MVNDGIDSIKSDLNMIHNKLNDLEPRLEATEQRLDAIEDRINNSNTSEARSDKSENIIFEINDRTRRARNMLVFNVAEKKSSDVKLRISHDKALVDKLIQAVVPDLENKNVKVLRLGKLGRDTPRPIKIIFNSEAEARRFGDLFSSDLVVGVDEAFGDVRIARDRTPRERQHLQNLRAELDKRMKSGEKNLTIKFRNGVPSIVSSLSKNV